MSRTRAPGDYTAPVEKRIGVLGLLAVIAMLAAMAQAPLIALMPYQNANLLDDAAVLLMVVASISRLPRARGGPVLIGILWLVIFSIAFVSSPLDSSVTLLVARQVTIPALLVLCGLCLRRAEWRLIIKVAVWIALLNSAYMAFEIFGIRLIDPMALVNNSEGSRIYMIDGLPGYYTYFGLGQSSVVRLGGLILNPPIAGISTGTAFVMAFHSGLFRWRWTVVIILGLATVLTISRAGLLIMVVGVALPWLLRRLGAIAATVFLSFVGAWVGIQLLDQAGSASHVNGLIAGIEDAFTHPAGRGFGHAGNYLAALGLVDIAESLVGIALSAGGILALLCVSALIASLVARTFRTPEAWESSLALGAVLAALLAETAGALNGTIALWLACGIALSSGRDLRMSPLEEITPR